MNQPQNISRLITKIAEQLHARFEDPILCEQSAWWIIEAITGMDQAHLIARGTIQLTATQQDQLTDWLNKIITQHMPVQYLIGYVPFNELDILVSPPTLIPRPETEEWCLQLIQQLKLLPNQKLTIIEPCTGTGCIALALAHALPNAHVYATDISPDAIALAKKNAQHNKINNVTFIQSDLFGNLPPIQADLIVVNPPYIAADEWPGLDTSVTKWEDKQALVANDHGLAIIKKIIHQAPYLLKDNVEMRAYNIPQLFIEIGYKQADDVVALMQQAHYTAIKVHKDLERKDRMVSGRVEHVASAKTG